MRLLISVWWLALALAGPPRGETARREPSGPSPDAAIAGCAVFPADNVWNARVDSLPVHAQSDAWVNTIGSGTGVHPDFGAGVWNGGRIGIPYTVVETGQPGVELWFTWPDESDPGPYPIPTDAPIEGPPGVGDRHILVVDRDACKLYEVYRAIWQPNGSISAGSGAVFDLKSNALRPDGWTSADAAGLPILPGLVRYDEVTSGTVDHAVRFTVPETQRAYVWPGRHYASDLVEARYPPMGARFRLKANVDISRLSPEAQTIAQGLKTHGMILADNGSPWFINGVPDERWDNDHLHDLGQLHGRDFEAVDASGLMVDPDSGQVGGAPSATPTDVPGTATSTSAPPSPTSEPSTPTATAEPATPTTEAATPTPTTEPATPTPSHTPGGPPTAVATETTTSRVPSATPSSPTTPAPTWRLWLPAVHTAATARALHRVPPG